VDGNCSNCGKEGHWYKAGFRVTGNPEMN
jgi:hypothetical protein